jgi:hypothetical protein
MFALGVILLALAGLLFSLFGRAYPTTSHSIWVDSGDLYFWAQWTGFWLLLTSLVLFGLQAWLQGLPLRSWRILPPLIATVLALYFLIWTMPERSNQGLWGDGALGLRVYLATKWTAWSNTRLAERQLAAFAGHWRNTDGQHLVIGADSILVLTGDTQVEVGEAGCGEAGRRFYSSEPRARLDYLVAVIGISPEAVPMAANGVSYPQLLVTCNGRDAYFLLLTPDRMLARIDDGPRGVFLRATP